MSNLRSLNLKSYYSEKTIQRSYNFDVDIVFIDYVTTNIRGFYDRMNAIEANAGFRDFSKSKYIKEWHVVSVDIPILTYQRDFQEIGIFKKTFPTLQHQGLEFTIEFEEDESGTIAFFIEWLKARIMDDNGFYYGPKISIFGDVLVNIYDNAINKKYQYVMKNCFYSASNKVTFAYNTNEAIKYQITFGCDAYEMRDFQNGLMIERRRV